MKSRYSAHLDSVTCSSFRNIIPITNSAKTSNILTISILILDLSVWIGLTFLSSFSTLTSGSTLWIIFSTSCKSVESMVSVLSAELTEAFLNLSSFFNSVSILEAQTVQSIFFNLYFTRIYFYQKDEVQTHKFISIANLKWRCWKRQAIGKVQTNILIYWTISSISILLPPI